MGGGSELKEKLRTRRREKYMEQSCLLEKDKGQLPAYSNREYIFLVKKALIIKKIYQE